MMQGKFVGLAVMAVVSFSVMANAYAAPTAAQLAREMADAVAPSLPMRIKGSTPKSRTVWKVLKTSGPA